MNSLKIQIQCVKKNDEFVLNNFKKGEMRS